MLHRRTVHTKTTWLQEKDPNKKLMSGSNYVAVEGFTEGVCDQSTVAEGKDSHKDPYLSTDAAVIKFTQEQCWCRQRIHTKIM